MDIVNLVITKTLLNIKEVRGDVAIATSPYENMLDVENLKFLNGEKTEDSAVRSVVIVDGEKQPRVVITERGRGKSKTVEVFDIKTLKKELKTVYTSVTTALKD